MILEYISIMQHVCCTALVSQNLRCIAIRVIMQQHGCRTVLLSQKYIQRRARFSYTLHSCNMGAERTAIIVFYTYIRSDTITVFYKYVRSETVT